MAYRFAQTPNGSCLHCVSVNKNNPSRSRTICGLPGARWVFTDRNAAIPRCKRCFVESHDRALERAAAMGA
jgi:hypothetical protein